MPMKVVVCFDSVRVTVPCGEGEIPVRELINKAVHRYKRAVGKGTDHWVEVNSLKTISGGGILDPDDQLNDVVDDREQLIAEFEERNRPAPPALSPRQQLQQQLHQHSGGDGASVSSTGTTSPELFSHLPQHQQHQLPPALLHQHPAASPGDSLSSSSSSAATVPPPLPSVPPPKAPTFGAPPPSSLSVKTVSQSDQSGLTSPLVPVVLDGGSEPGSATRCDSSSSNSNNVVASDVVVVTPRDLSMGSTLRVRRGSEPNLAILGDTPAIDLLSITAGNLRPRIARRESVRDSDEPRSESSEDEKHVRPPMTNSLDRKKVGMARFTRDSWRSSLSSRPEMYKWLEAQQKAEEQSRAAKAKELEQRLSPLEGIGPKDGNIAEQENEYLICLPNDGGPLGIHAIAAQEKGSDVGLLIQSVEEGRPVHRDGRIQAKDIIVEINGTSLHSVPFLRAQEIFRAAMDTPEIRLKVVKDEKQQSSPPPEIPARRKPGSQPPPVMPKPRHHAPLKPSPLAASPKQKMSPVPAPRDSAKAAPDSSFSSHGSTHSTDNSVFTPSFTNNDPATRIPTSSGNAPDLLSSSSSYGPLKKAPSVPHVIKPGPPIKAPKKTLSSAAPALPARNPKRQNSNTPVSPTSPTLPSPALVSPTSPPPPGTEAPVNAVFNTRRIGKKLVIKLRKGVQGLGFSVTSRDNPTGGDCPIYIRNILPKGAAVQDGQLRSGDRLLEVNGVEMTGKTQPEAVSFLRTLPEGSMVELVVSRQEEVDEKFKVPRKMGEQNQASADPRVPEPLPGSSSHNGGISGRAGEDVEDEDDESACTVLPQHPSQSLDSIDGRPSAKEKLTFCIPLNETGSAGLGVSVKGKTQSSDMGLRDLGIFVKTVLQGGAAYKDGRLQVNDQLLEVNGIKLEGQPNTAAMESLRAAMMEEADSSGFITLSVLRREPGTPLSPPPPIGRHPSVGNAPGMNHPSLPDPRTCSSVPIIHQRSSSASDTLNNMQRFGPENTSMPSPIAPARSKRVAALRERFSSDQGGNGLRNDSYTRATNESFAHSPSPGVGEGGLRNESYARATHDSMNDSGAFSQVLPSQPKWNQNSGGRPVGVKENIPIGDTDPNLYSSKQQRPHSTIGFLHGPRVSHNSVSDDEAFVRDSMASSKEGSDMSPSIELIAPFAREGFGRQSMSEKRKGHLDPRSTETYKNVKANKENKENKGANVVAASGGGRSSAPPPATQGHQVEKPVPQPQQVPPSPQKNVARPESSPPPPAASVEHNLMHDISRSSHQPSRSVNDPGSAAANMKKSSSVEDLSNPGPQNVVSNSSSGTKQNRDMSPAWRQTRFGRARACNDSFRAAVDRSYDALDPALMDTLEEESAESGAFTLDPSNSGRSSISSENPEDTNSLKRRKAKEKEKKGGLLKGFLRFGKGRKSNEEAMRRSRSEERPGERVLVERRQDYNSDLASPTGPGEDKWDVGVGQSVGDAKNLWFMPLPGGADQSQPQPQPHQQQQQRGRRLSKTDQDRIEEEYARLREQHTSQQKLRSQSVDPSHHRHHERSSPFQPYSSSVGSQQQRMHYDYPLSGKGYLTDQVVGYTGDRQDTGGHTDARQFHPAAVGYMHDTMGQQYGGNKQYFTDSDAQEETGGGRPLAKAALSRAEYIQQLRSLYQQQHKQRQGVYPLDDAEEKYERQMQEMERGGIGPYHEYFKDSSRDPHLLRFTDRPPSRQIEQRRSERTFSSTSAGSNNNFNSIYTGTASSTAYHHHPHHHPHYDYSSSSTTFPAERPHSRGATISASSYEDGGSYYHHQQHSGSYHHHHQQYQQQHHQNHYHYSQQQHQQQQPHQLRSYDYSPRSANLDYGDYPTSQDNATTDRYRRPSYEVYTQDPQFYRGPPQAYRSAPPSQYPSHRSTTPYSDPTSAKV